MKPGLLVADVTNYTAGYILNCFVGNIRSTRFTCNDHQISRCHSLRGNPGVRIRGHVSVNNRIGNKVAHLVRMTFRNGFTGE